MPFLQKNANTQGGWGGGELCPLTKQVQEGRFSEHNLFQIKEKTEQYYNKNLKNLETVLGSYLLTDLLLVKK